MQLKNKVFIDWWFTPHFPKIHYDDPVGFLKKWLVNPIKRKLARFYISFLKNFTDIKVIGITGSAGKTTTKEMLTSILKHEGKTVCSVANIDPIYNIPNTILKTPPGTKYLILEMGVEYPTEMDFYLWEVKPDLGIITNIFPTHLEYFNDIDGVFKEKSKLAYSLSSNGIVVLNENDKKLQSLKNKVKCKIIWFKNGDDAFQENAYAASAAAIGLNVDSNNIEKGLSDYKKPPHRLITINHKSGALILDDSYNSNPWAAMATVKYFNSISKGKKIGVLGDMLELGSFDEKAHRELGRYVAKSNFDVVIGVGKSSKFLIDEIEKNNSNIETFLFANAMEALPTVKSFIQRNSSILIKGSRSIGLDKLLDKLL